jgi:class 3 adenylate cyclase
LPALAAQLTLTPGPLLTTKEAAAEAGMTAERVAALSRIVGLAPIDPDEPTFTLGAVESFRSVDLGIAMFGRDPTIHFGRVLGNSMARIAEAAQSAFRVVVDAGMAERHATELEVVRAQVEGIELFGVIPQLMETVLRAHLAQAIGREISDIDAAYQGVSTVAVGFVDLVGFTPLSQALTPGELMTLISEFEGQAMDTVATYGGRVVKLIGDEVMFTAQDAPSGCAIALDILDAFKGDVRVEGRGGLHVGPTLAWGGDRYGATVNCASRVSELAVPHEMLVTEAVRDATPDDAGFTFEPAGRRILRGFPDPVPLYSATRAI